MARVGDVYERRAVHATHDRDLMTVLRVVVTPDVAQLHAALAAHRRDRQERHQVALIAVERERPADRTPAAARRIADIEPHRSGTTIVQRPDERGVAPQNQCAPEASIPTGDWARSDDLVHLPTTGRIAIVDVHGAVARISAEIPDHDPRA